MLTRLLLLISIAASLLLRRWLPIWLFVGYIAFKIYKVATKNYFEGVDKRLKGPPGVPFLGSVFWMQGDWSEQSHKWSKVYGPIYRVLLAGIAQVVVADLEYAKEVVNNPALQYKAEDVAETVQEALGKNSLVMIGGKEWRMQRSALSKIFHQKNMTDFMETMNSAAQILITKMNDVNEKFSFDVDQHYMRLAADVIIKTFFSLDLNIQTDSNVPILNAINSLTETVQSWFFSPWERFNVFALRKFYKQRKFLRGYFHDLIEGRRANPDARQGRPDVLDLMIQVKDDETGQPALTTEAIIDQAITFFFAGHDTTAHTMSWTTYLLAEHPELQDKVHEEIVSVLGDNEHVTMTDIPKLKYLLGAIKESLRLYPATSTLTRQAQEDFTVGGYEFKKGTIVTLALAAIHFDEKYWPDPYKFDPTRHTVETNAEDPAQFFKWWPFSLKERNCIGMNFALLELRIVLALMFKHFEFRPDRLRPPVPGTKFTTYPTNGLNVFLRKRSTK